MLEQVKCIFTPEPSMSRECPTKMKIGLQFRPDSRLLIISGWVDGVGGYLEEATFYYVVENNRFRLVRKPKSERAMGSQRRRITKAFAADGAIGMSSSSFCSSDRMLIARRS